MSFQASTMSCMQLVWWLKISFLHVFFVESPYHLSSDYVTSQLESNAAPNFGSWASDRMIQCCGWCSTCRSSWRYSSWNTTVSSNSNKLPAALLLYIWSRGRESRWAFEFVFKPARKNAINHELLRVLQTSLVC